MRDFYLGGGLLFGRRGPFNDRIMTNYVYISSKNLQKIQSPDKKLDVAFTHVNLTTISMYIH